MNKKALTSSEGIVVAIIILLVVTTMFLLSYLGVIPARKYEPVEVLQADFIPYQREGKLSITEVKLCEALDTQKNCINEKTTFTKPTTVSIRAVVETSPTNGKVFLLENYRVRGPDGLVILTADSDLPFEMDSSLASQEVLFTDFFSLAEDLSAGPYTFELVITNPLLNQEATSTSELVVREHE